MEHYDPPSVHIISDVICPWCYVGKRRLEQAFALPDQPPGVVIHWLPYELNPDMPREGMERAAYRAAKFGSPEKSRELDERLVSVGKEAGIDFHFDRIERTPNTFDAHRLIWQAAKHGVQDTIVERLFHAYFVEGLDVGDRAVLTGIGEAAGIDGAGAFLGGDGGVESVKQELAVAQRLRVQGVPYFMFNQRLAVSGAQTPEVLLAAYQEASGSEADSSPS